MELMSGCGVVFGEGCLEVFGDRVVWFAVEEGGDL